MEQKHIRRVGGRRLLTGAAALLCALTLSTGVAYADTDGTEMQVMDVAQGGRADERDVDSWGRNGRALSLS